jgi:4-hydroxybenzoate polyprenyltransferase
LKIVAGVVAYRLRKLEMANLAAGTSIAIALHLPWLEVCGRTLFAFFLNVLVYLNNDYVDVGLDLRSSDKDAQKTRFLAEHMSAALYTQWALFGSLLVAALCYDPGLLAPLIIGGAVCVAYSAYLKRRAYVDIPAMMVWGMMMPLCGAPLSSLLGLCLALQLGLFSGVFETIQVMRDADADAAAGVRTTGVALGSARTLWLGRVLMLAASSYALLVMQPVAAGVSALALLVPSHPQRVERYWTHVKMIYGVAWLLICAWVFLQSRSFGLLFSVARSASYG